MQHCVKFSVLCLAVREPNNDRKGHGGTCRAAHLFPVRPPMLSVSLSTWGTTVACAPVPCLVWLLPVSEDVTFPDEGPPASVDSALSHVVIAELQSWAKELGRPPISSSSGPRSQCGQQ